MTWRQIKRLLVGKPLRSSHAVHERLSNAKALAVLSSDALSSVAYGTEEILLALILAGSGALHWSLPIGAAIAGLLAILTVSYRQTIHAYPNGGGAYIVAKENLGTYAGLVAGSALLLDYLLTVAVSISSGVAAITSAFPALYDHRVLLCLIGIGIVTLGNLRGVRESGTIFAAPTYLFIGSVALMIGVGLWRMFVSHTLPPSAPPPVASQPGVTLSLFLILRAFASGCAALTGVEAISNGVPAFRPPESRNAANTLVAMALLLGSMFLGITVMSWSLGVVPKEGLTETVVSQVARAVFDGGPLYYLVQVATAVILLLAANTSFADFPRLASLMARDGFLPNQLAYRGDRLAFSNGIIVLGLLASVLVIIFGGDTHALIPLYAVGVFLSFTLSQSGMVMHWLRYRVGNWRASAAVNALGALTTAVTLLVIGATKFVHGAWVVILLIPLLVRLFAAIHAHYERFRSAMAINGEKIEPVPHTILVPIGHVNKSVYNTLRYAKSLGQDIQALYVALDPEKAERVRADWDRIGSGIPLIVLNSPYRSIVRPLVHYIHHLERKQPDHIVTVLLPEFVMARWWENLLHNNTALYIKAALLFEPGVVVASVPYHLSKAV